MTSIIDFAGRALLAATLTAIPVASSLAQPFETQGRDEETSDQAADPVTTTAEWMLDRPEARSRAAALAVLAEQDDGAHSSAIVDAVRSTTDGAAMLWLAHACRAADIQQQCIGAGLDDAIVAYDSANLFARTALFPKDRVADLITETRRESLYYFALIEAWYDALSRGPAAEEVRSPGDRLAQAYAIGAAWSTPAYASLVETCRNASPGAALDRACQNLASRMVEAGESMLSFMIGRSIERRGEPAAEEERSAAQLASDRASCQMQALEPVITSQDDKGIREFIQLLKRHGEFEAWDRLAAEHDVDCSDPPPLVQEAASQAETAFLTALSSVADDMMKSDQDRERAAGLAMQLVGYAQPVEPPAALLDELERQIHSITDPAALAWLAAACGGIDIEDLCLTAGLDTAIVRYDPGNLISRLPLLDELTIESALLEATRTRSYVAESSETWFLNLYPELVRFESELAELKMSYPMYVLSTSLLMHHTYATPSLQGLTDVCLSSAPPNTDIADACARVAKQLVESGRTFLEYQFGLSMQRQQAERDAKDADAALIAADKERYSAVMMCQSQAFESRKSSLTREEAEIWIAEQLEYGERRTYARAAERAGVDCSDPPPWPPEFNGED